MTLLSGGFRDVCDAKVEDDGLLFDASSVSATRIKEEAEYEGVRITGSDRRARLLGSDHRARLLGATIEPDF